MNYYILCLLAILTRHETVFRLSTKSKLLITSSDTIASTLGYFRILLISPTCQLRIE